MLKGRTTLEDRTHRQETIEPIAELSRETFTNPISWEPSLPVFPIRVVSQRTHPYNPRIKPRISNVRNSFHAFTTLAAFDLNCIDVGPMRRVTIKGVPPCDGPLVQLLLAAEDFEVTTV